MRRRGCLEAYTSNLATLARYLGFDPSLPDTSRRLRETAFTMEDLIARARSGDAAAREALQQSGRYLAIGLGAIVNSLNPGRIYIGGEIAEAWDLIGDEVEEAVAARVMARAAARTPITPEPGSAHPRLRGATALIVAPLFAAPQVA